ncbi:MAG: FtsH protease activity modulator HflK [Alphaproteobacteria bacterium]|nr:MAG: FtsH protease activity modulator HflK [Alphaproteobacteria bacterium]
MSWNKGGSKGPWGSPPSGGSNGTHGPKGGGNRPPEQPDLDELIRKSQESLRNALGGGGRGKGGGYKGGAPSMRPLILGGVALFALWCASGIYRVDADEQGVVLRFGKFHDISEPGLNYHLPSPIETVFTPRVTTINREEIGFRSDGGSNNRIIKPEESLMLTGDKNLVNAQFEVQWRIKDAEQYLFHMRFPDYLVKPVAETALREVMGNTTLAMALSDKRQAIAMETRTLMQKILDDYETGIEIFEVNLLAVDAPEPVVDAFIDVLSAQQEKETLQNQAQKYRDGVLPMAQGQAEKMVKDAEAYKEAVITKAKGEAAQFTSITKQYERAEDVTKKRMYLETMEDILSGMNKIIVDGNAGNGVMPYLPLKELKPSEPTKQEESR